MLSRPGLFHLSLKATGQPSFGFAFLCCVGRTVVHMLSDIACQECVHVDEHGRDRCLFTVLCTCLYVTL